MRLHSYATKEKEETQLAFDVDRFVDHLLSNIYFVVIETHAGLSKTLQIFSAINTTGLDLNGGDIFKIRMYEYLRDKTGADESAFDQIGDLYARIDAWNTESGHSMSILHILGTYQNILIAKHRLPQSLYQIGSHTFFERLFDTLFNLYDWPEFAKIKVSSQLLSLDELHSIINVHLLWERTQYLTFEDYCGMHSIWQSRYGKHWNLVFLFLYRFQHDELYAEKLFAFIKSIGKLFVAYSVIFDKAIGNIHTFIYYLIGKLMDENTSFDILMKMIDDKTRGEVPYHERLGHEVFMYQLRGDINYNYKKKNLLCRLSAMLEEDYQQAFDKQANISKLYSNECDPLDIEHIEAFNHKDEFERKLIHKEWGDVLNSIGNLMILQCKINR